jgi:hypothetical protein
LRYFESGVLPAPRLRTSEIDGDININININILRFIFTFTALKLCPPFGPLSVDLGH